jgi:hypothetical protein
VSIWPEERLREDIQSASGAVERSVADLLRDFGVRQPGAASRRQVERRLREAGIRSKPSLEEAGLGGTVALCLRLDEHSTAQPEGEPSAQDRSGHKRVCPRCGEEAKEHQYCSECGLHLWEQPELPTRETWEAGHARSSDAESPTTRTVTDLRQSWRKLPRAARWGVPAGSLLGLILIGLLVALAGDGTATDAQDAQPVEEADSASTPTTEGAQGGGTRPEPVGPTTEEIEPVLAENLKRAFQTPSVQTNCDTVYSCKAGIIPAMGGGVGLVWSVELDDDLCFTATWDQAALAGSGKEQILQLPESMQETYEDCLSLDRGY